MWPLVLVPGDEDVGTHEAREAEPLVQRTNEAPHRQPVACPARWSWVQGEEHHLVACRQKQDVKHAGIIASIPGSKTHVHDAATPKVLRKLTLLKTAWHRCRLLILDGELPEPKNLVRACQQELAIWSEGHSKQGVNHLPGLCRSTKSSTQEQLLQLLRPGCRAASSHQQRQRLTGGVLRQRICDLQRRWHALDALDRLVAQYSHG
mmetsp:Transcript_34784/g.62633  ORF Transcript_34784/g.62633 Transcript_34784/m.62633 type:complete len:206 (+) Transcript_34784:148-765(+)